jgi:diguanylate cyclase (GGDEF)-like protein
MLSAILPLLMLVAPASAAPQTAACIDALQQQCWKSPDPAVALAAAQEALALTTAAHDARNHARSLSCRGNALEAAGRLDEASNDYGMARAEAERLGDRKLLADILMQSGYLRYYRGDMNAALVDLQKAYALYTALKLDDDRRTALATIAHVYADPSVAQYDRAIEYYRQVLPEYERAGNKTDLADTLYNLASTYESKGAFASALTEYRRALTAETQLKRLDEVAYVKRSIGVTLTKLNRADEALHWFDEALQTFIRSKDEERIAYVRQSRGIAYRKLGRIGDAISDLEASRARFEATKNTRFLEKTQDELAQAYASAGRWKDAYEARTAHAAMQRELAEKLREEHTSRLRVQFDAEKKEQENRALIRENALRARALDAAARVRRLQTIVLILGAAIIVVLTLLILRVIRDSRRMRVMALTDELTRLPNRRHLLALGEDELRRTRDGGTPFSLVAFDIDYFKRINDTWGHAAGDVVLQRVAHACRTAVRPSDRIGRTGGEEFTVVLPATRVTDAVTVAERLRTAVEAIDCTDVDPSLHVTISLGVAEWTPADTTLARLAARADEVLYRAKEQGRNRVELAVA